MIFFTADNHFYHKNVIEYCARPFTDVDHMHTEMIRRWNVVVQPEDYVWILGDFSFAKPNKTNEILDQLNGFKNLVKGNHDHGTTKWHINKLDSQAVVHLEGVGLVNLSHYPYGDVRFPDRAPANDGKWLLHGHVHTTWKVRDKMVNVGVDQWNYAPVSIEEIERLIA